jgi:type 1 glutamine amidotransferase
MKHSSTVTRRRSLEWLAAAALVPTVPGAKRPNILVFTKSSGYEHDIVKRQSDAPALSERIITELGRKHNFNVVATKDGRVFDGDLMSYDAFFFYTSGDLIEIGPDRNPPMSVQGKAALLNAVRGGKGFVAVHSASDSFHSKGGWYVTQQQPDPYIGMLGGEFLTHGEQQEGRVNVVDPTFPGLEHAGPSFKITEEWYSLKNFAPDMHVLLLLETEGMQGSPYKRPPYPLAWVRHEGRGRLYYNAMGHREDVWESERYQTMLVGAITWALGTIEGSVGANILSVAPQAAAMPPQD